MLHTFYPLPVPRRNGLGLLGMGRIGKLRKPVTLAAMLRRVKKRLGVYRVLLAGGGNVNSVITTAAVGAGSCGDMWRRAAGQADVFVTGEMRHHDALAAAEAGLCVICVGHSNSERHALPLVAEQLGAATGGSLGCSAQLECATTPVPLRPAFPARPQHRIHGSLRVTRAVERGRSAHWWADCGAARTAGGH